MKAGSRHVTTVLAGLSLLFACGPRPWWDNPHATWITTLGGAGSDVGSGILEAEDGGLFLVGTMESGFRPEALGEPYLVRTDAGGVIRWQRSLDPGNSEKGLSVLPAGRGDLLIGLERSPLGQENVDFALLRVDSAGREIWRRDYETPSVDHLVGVLEKSNGGFLLFGNVMDHHMPVSGFGAAGNIGWDYRSSPFLICTDQEGQILWTRSYDKGNNTVVADARATPDGGALILSTVTYFPEGNDDLYLLRVDAEGNERWVRTWTEGRTVGHALVALTDGSYLVVGGHSSAPEPDRSTSDLLVAKVDRQGNPIWRRVFGDPELMDWGKKAVETDDGGIALVGSRTKDLHGSPESILLLKLDSSGGLVWERKFETGVHNMFGGLLQRRDGGFAIFGSTRTRAGPFDMFLIRTNGSGESVEEEP